MSSAHLSILLRRTGWLTLAVEVVRALFGTVCVLLGGRTVGAGNRCRLGLVSGWADRRRPVDRLPAAGGGRFHRRPNVAEPVQSAARGPANRTAIGRAGQPTDQFGRFHRDARAAAQSAPLVRQSVQRGEELAAQVSSFEAVDMWRPVEDGGRGGRGGRRAGCAPIWRLRACSRWSCRGTSTRRATIPRSR